MTVKRLNGLDGISAGDWNRLSDGSNPFVLHEYLHGLEKHDCLGDQGWLPSHFAVYAGSNLLGALPLYLKTNSYGEFVFDWAWADAYERAGGKYYPKLVSTIPFAPVIGPRLLVDPGLDETSDIKSLLVKTALEFIESSGVSSLHALFIEDPDQSFFAEENLLKRLTCQFHWMNRGYRDFQDFLDGMTSKKRKQIRRERKQVQEHRIEIEILPGDQISEEQWRVFYQFYCSTFYRRWGSPRLTLDFFRSLSERMPEKTLLILARHGKDYVAGSFSMVGTDTVFGRHWGCSEHYPFLHFELCYYQTIEFCILNGLTRVDAGVQGEHKLSRGFSPVGGVSYHWLRHPGFRDAVRDYLDRETREIQWHIEALMEHLPYKTEN